MLVEPRNSPLSEYWYTYPLFPLFQKPRKTESYSSLYARPVASKDEGGLQGKESIIFPEPVSILNILLVEASTAHRDPPPQASPVIFSPGESMVSVIAQFSEDESSEELDSFIQPDRKINKKVIIIPGNFIVFSVNQ